VVTWADLRTPTAVHVAQWLRRPLLLYHWIDYPPFGREVEIVVLREPTVSDSPAPEVVAAVTRLRESDLVKPPGTRRRSTRPGHWSSAGRPRPTDLSCAVHAPQVGRRDDIPVYDDAFQRDFPDADAHGVSRSPTTYPTLMSGEEQRLGRWHPACTCLRHRSFAVRTDEDLARVCAGSRRASSSPRPESRHDQRLGKWCGLNRTRGVQLSPHHIRLPASARALAAEHPRRNLGGPPSTLPSWLGQPGSTGIPRMDHFTPLTASRVRLGARSPRPRRLG
jgi:hypothetical protein